jgi:hypothetical protein
MKSIEVFNRLLDRIMLADRWRNKGPGKVVENATDEERVALSNLTSEEVGKQLRVEEYWMIGSDHEAKSKMLELEKKLGIQPPPRKKYDEHG